MNTIRKLTILNLLAAAVLSCTGVELTPQPIGDSPVPVEVVFSIPDDGPGTRSSYQALGSSVDDVNLWIVSDGTVIHHSFLEGQTTMALVLTAGRSYSFFALANMGYSKRKTRVFSIIFRCRFFERTSHIVDIRCAQRGVPPLAARPSPEKFFIVSMIIALRKRIPPSGTMLCACILKAATCWRCRLTNTSNGHEV